MDTLISANSFYLQSDSADVNSWGEIFKIVPGFHHISDRTNSIVQPYQIDSTLPMPLDLSGFNKTYEECVNERATELVTLSNKLDVPIGILYSGGIDSTLVLISFLKIMSASEARARLILYMNSDSINENPVFYRNYIRGKLDIKSSERCSSLFNGEVLLVTGEFNDQLFCIDISAAWKRYGSDITKIPYSLDTAIEYLKYRSFSHNSAVRWAELIDLTIKNSVVNIVSMFDFLWWINFNFKWDSIYYRFAYRADKLLLPLMTEESLNNNMKHFYQTSDFQKWSMLNSNLKLGKTYGSYKLAAKEIIYNFNKDEYYLNNKIKVFSGDKLWLQKNPPIAITNNYEFLYEINKEELYEPNNDWA